MTGWFNIVGLIGIVASVGYGAAFFLNALLGLYGVDIFGINFGDYEHILAETFLLFLLILVFYTVVNIFADRGLALINNISVGWHLLGRRGHPRDPGLRPRRPPGPRASSSASGSTTPVCHEARRQPRLLVPGAPDRVPADDVHPDRLRRLGPHRRGDPGAATAPPRASGVGVLLGLIGWFVLLAFLFAANDVACRQRGRRLRRRDLHHAARNLGGEAVFLIATVGQLFCGAAGLTSASRTWYAFSRDRAMPGWNCSAGSTATGSPSTP